MTTPVLEIPTAGTTTHRAADRQDAWTILGADVSHATSAEEALKAADLFGWDVRKIGDVAATEVTEDGTNRIEMPRTFANVRTNPRTGATEFLATVGNVYTPIQMESHIEPMDLLKAETGATFGRGGAYKNGARAFLTMELPNGLEIGGFDSHDITIVAFFPHDGSGKASLHVAPMRLRCGNMQTMFIEGATHSWSIPHTASASARIAEVHKALTGLFGYQEAFAAEAERMLHTPLSLARFEEVVDGGVFDPLDFAPTPRQQKTWQKRMDTLRTLFLEADTQQGIRGTAWAGYNAVTEYLDHYATASNVSVRAARSMVSGSNVAKKNRARRLLMLAA